MTNRCFSIRFWFVWWFSISLLNPQKTFGFTIGEHIDETTWLLEWMVASLAESLLTHSHHWTIQPYSFECINLGEDIDREGFHSNVLCQNPCSIYFTSPAACYLTFIQSSEPKNIVFGSFGICTYSDSNIATRPSKPEHSSAKASASLTSSSW